MSEGEFRDLIESGTDPPPELLRQSLLRDWRQLFAYRKQWGDSICAALGEIPAEMTAARAAFGLATSSAPPPWLYRDFYVEHAPSDLGVDRCIGRLRRGDLKEALDMLGDEVRPAESLMRLWYDVTTLVGDLGSTPSWNGDHGTERAALEPDPPGVGGGAPLRVENEQAVRRDLTEALGGDLGIETHRRNVRSLVEGLRAGASGDAALYSLLWHHTDLLIASRDVASPFGSEDEEPPSTESWLTALELALKDDKVFVSHLERGLESPSSARRWLSYRLLRWQGILEPGSHPDDEWRPSDPVAAATWTMTAPADSAEH